MSYCLGIDIGTTSLSCVIYDPKTNTLIDSISRPTNANCALNKNEAEQDAEKIVTILDECITSFSIKHRQAITNIGVTGQMHGIVLWGNEQKTRFITWQDKRVSKQDLETFRTQSKDSTINNGFGSTVLAALSKTNQLNDYQFAATMPDYIVSLVGAIEKPVTDPTLAASWGLFNLQNLSWDSTAIDSLNIPTHFYPEVLPSGTHVGQISSQYSQKWGLEPNVKITVASGDNQASLLGSLTNWETEMNLTLGTGAQVSIVLNKNPFENDNFPKNIELRPFYQNNYIAVAAGLCGGSAFKWLISWFQQWQTAMGYPSKPESELFSMFIQQGMESYDDTPLVITPLFLGSRSQDKVTGTISNINLTNFTPGAVSAALAKGIVHELHQMLPSTLTNTKKTIIASGNALRKNRLLVRAVEDMFKRPVVITDQEEEAAIGAAKLTVLSSR